MFGRKCMVRIRRLSLLFSPWMPWCVLFALPAYSADTPAVQAELNELLPLKTISRAETLNKSIEQAVEREFDQEISRCKNKAKRAQFFAGEYDHPMREFDHRDPEDLYPRRHKEFKGWAEDKLVDGALEALENHPNTQDAVDSLISLSSIGFTSEGEDEHTFTYSELKEDAEKLDTETRRTLSVGTLDGVARRVLGPEHKTLVRMKWLDYHDGVDDLARWEGRVQNIQLFGNPRLSIDQVKTELTYESAKVSVAKVRPLGLPVLAQAKFETDPDDTKWGVVLTKEKQDPKRAGETTLDGEPLKPSEVPLKWKLDVGVLGNKDETKVGAVVSGEF